MLLLFPFIILKISLYDRAGSPKPGESALFCSGEAIEIGGKAAVLAAPGLLGQQAGPVQLRQGAFYCRAGEAQVLCHGVDGVPALAVLVGPVVEVDQHLLGPGAQFRVIVDLVKIAHFYFCSFPV